MNYRAYHQQGFTLLEVLMVVSLMAILSGIFLSFSFTSVDEKLTSDAKAFINQLESAQQNAAGLGVIIALSVTPQSYQFLRLNLPREKFEALESFSKQEFDLNQSLNLTSTGDPIEWEFTRAKSAYIDYTLENPGAAISLLLPAGDVKPAFEIIFSSGDGNIKITVDELGQIQSPFNEPKDFNQAVGS